MPLILKTFLLMEAVNVAHLGQKRNVQMCVECSALNCNKEWLVRYWGKTF